MIKVGVIGVGYWGPNIVRNFADIAGADLVSVADPDSSKVEKMIKRFPYLQGLADGDEIIRDKSIDAVAIITPAETHYDFARRALEAGKHVLVEKPLTLIPAESAALIELAEKKQLTLMVGHTFEYNPAVRMLKEITCRDDFGKILYIYSTRVNLGIFRHGINAMWNLAPHDVSILNYIFDAAPLSVRSLGQSFIKPGIEDVVFLYYEYPSGSVAHVHVSWLDPSKVRRVTVVGEKKMAVYDDLDNEQKLKVYDRGFDSTLFEEGGIRDYQVRLRAGDILSPKIPNTEPLRTECTHFIDCAREGTRPLTDGENGLRVVQALAAAEESLRGDGRKVDIG